MSMPSITKSPILAIFCAVILGGCAFLEPGSPLIGEEPEAGSVVNRAPRTLRLYFNELPDVPRSEITLQGPERNMNLRGMHNMGENDLMLEINDQLADGEYKVLWRTYLGSDDNEYRGEYTFTVLAN